MYKLEPTGKDKRDAALTLVATIVALVRLAIEVYKLARRIQL